MNYKNSAFEDNYICTCRWQNEKVFGYMSCPGIARRN